MAIRNYKDLANVLGVDKPTEERLSRWVYNTTVCGAWLKFVSRGIEIGSIVEGVDFDCETHKLKFPFSIDEFNATVNAIEEEAKYIWNQTHGCERCEADGFEGEWGHPAINPDCPECHGEGIVI